jgi:AraC family transcriptional regulator
MHPVIILMMKGGCLMDSLRSMNNALAYIEEHLTEDIDYSEFLKLLTVQSIILSGCFLF